MPHDIECEIFMACTSPRITVEARCHDSTVHRCNSFLTVPPPKVTQLHRARTMSIVLEYLDSNAVGIRRLSIFHPQEWYASSFNDVVGATGAKPHTPAGAKGVVQWNDGE